MCVCNRPKTAESPRGLYFEIFIASLRVFCIPLPHNPETVVGARFRKTTELPPTDLLAYQQAPPSTFPPMTAISFYTHDGRREPAAVSLSHTPPSNSHSFSHANVHWDSVLCSKVKTVTHENASQCHILKGQQANFLTSLHINCSQLYYRRLCVSVFLTNCCQIFYSLSHLDQSFPSIG